jgi:tRNA(fMet)-specific endonuclease VapC
MSSTRRPRAHPDERGILDTNTVIFLNRLDDPSLLPQHPEITTITLAELSVGPLVANEPNEQAARQAHLQTAESSFRALPFDAAAARRFGSVAANLRQAGRQPAARAYDALIAAVALANGLPLYTVNPGDFEGIEGLTVRTVPHPHEASRPAT